MKKQTGVTKIVDAIIQSEDAVFTLAQSLCDAVFPLKYEREILASLGAEIAKELPKSYLATFNTVAFASACAMAGICRKGTGWILNGMGLVSPSAVCQALDKIHGNEGKRKQAQGKPKASAVEKVAAQAAKLSAKERKELIKLLQAMA